MITNAEYIKKADFYKRPLMTRAVKPVSEVEIIADEKAYQGVSARVLGEARPVTLMSGDSVTLDFGEHCVGYVNLFLHCVGEGISDSPTRLKFSFGEFPLELYKNHSDYKGLLGNGWLQYEEKTAVFTPCSVRLDRRYAFRYMRVERLDNAPYPMVLDGISAECVSAVSLEAAEKYKASDEVLQRIYDASLCTLRDCEQDVFEDGPKRDRRLWIGDLRLQALTDYTTFKNLDLIKRCIYLFAGYLNSKGEVAPCVYPDCPPFRLEWTFADYSMFLVSCIYDYYKATGDRTLADELYGTAFNQLEKVSSRIDADLQATADGTFIDWCPSLDKSVALLGVYAYCLGQLNEIRADAQLESEIKRTHARLRSFFKDGVLVTPLGQVSQHSQVWGVLSGAFDRDECRKILEGLDTLETEYTFRTPYARHYYIEALVFAGLEDKALSFIRDFWGRILDSGYDCCPEIFNPDNQFESPYEAAEINSACHAWSCTPAYWIKRLCKGE